MAEVLELAYVATLRAFSRMHASHTPELEELHVGGFWGIVSRADPADPWSNWFFYQAPPSAGDLEVLANTLNERGITSWRLAVFGAHAAGLRRTLEANGYALGVLGPVMALELDVPLADAQWPTEVREAESIRALAGLNEAAYGRGAQRWEEKYAPVPPREMHVLELCADGTPVCAGAAYDVGQDTGVFLIATAPEARGRGHATRLMTAIHLAARSRGSTRCLLHANPPATPLYKSLGYQEVGLLEQWLYPAPPAS